MGKVSKNWQDYEAKEYQDLVLRGVRSLRNTIKQEKASSTRDFDSNRVLRVINSVFQSPEMVAGLNRVRERLESQQTPRGDRRPEQALPQTLRSSGSTLKSPKWSAKMDLSDTPIPRLAQDIANLINDSRTPAKALTTKYDAVMKAALKAALKMRPKLAMPAPSPRKKERPTPY